jgi:hypothetical protein
MGNRAVVAFTGSAGMTPSMYLHWNGGLASVQAFMEVAKAMRLPATDAGLQQLADIIEKRFFEGGSCCTMPFERADRDNWDNGLYWIDHEWNVVGREFRRCAEEVDAQKTREIRESILTAIAAR